MDEILTEIRRYNKLKMITDDEIIPYVEMTDFEIAKFSVDFKNLLKARVFYTIVLLGQKLWLKIQQRANEYDESLDTFKDVKQWEEYWMDKFYKLITKKNTGGYFYAAV
ncbi:competence protein CoiA [Campylobacter sp. faydin G-140]|uniref:competence protein CoiA n=1 Tax=Campylobacter anatolicus TaxID=2829105 RepID=UPI001B9E5BA6|nr:competence protein CoiA [Campylobacter anatolicus]MBR8466253.1 competence protein CoiA [Campylobacter anatolicus]